MASVFEGFLKGFGAVGSDIQKKRDETEAETEAYIKKYQTQKAIDLWAAQEAATVEAKRQAQQTEEALTYRRKMSDGANLVPQATMVFNQDGAVNPALSDETTGFDDGLPAPSDSPVLPSRATAGPDITEQEFLAEFLTLSENTRKDTANAAMIAERNARERKAKTLRADAGLDIRQKEYELKLRKEGLAPDGTPLQEETLSSIYGESAGDNEPYLVAPEFVSEPDLTPKGLAEFNRTTTRQKILDASRSALTTASTASSKAKKLIELSQSADTGPLIGSSLGRMLNEFREDPNQAALNALIKDMLPERPHTVGPQSDRDVINALDALPGLAKSGASNETIAKSLYQASKFYEERLSFYQYLQQKTGGVTENAALEFNKYVDENPMFIPSDDGSLVENPNRVSFAGWQRGVVPEAPAAPTVQAPTGGVQTPSTNPLRAKYGY